MEDDLTGISEQHRNKSGLRWFLPLAMILTVAATACSSSSGEPAPDFNVTMFQGQDVVGGEEVSLRSLIGDKPIVLNFWAGLCPPCRAEMPDLQKFDDEYKDQALLLGVDLGQFTGLGTIDDAKDLLAELAVTYPAGFTSNPDVIKDYEVLGMPTTIFIDKEGRIFNKWTGALDKSVLVEKTDEMLGQ